MNFIFVLYRFTIIIIINIVNAQLYTNVGVYSYDNPVDLCKGDICRYRVAVTIKKCRKIKSELEKLNKIERRINKETSKDLDSLESITFGESVTTIGQSAFYGCTSLTTAPELPATILANYCYVNMFQSCTSLTTVPVLSATTLVSNCYVGMFRGCTSLTQAPVLSAATLANSCYRQMFNGCTSLTTAPELPATELADYCYYEMFSGCTSLNYIKCLATDISANGCTNSWVDGVASTGTFVKNASMSSWTTGENGIPANWTRVNA